MKKSNSPEAVLLRSAYPLTHQGVCRVLEYAERGDAKDLEWLASNNPPGKDLAVILRALSVEELAAVWPKLEKSITAQTALSEAREAFAAANNELKDALHPALAKARDEKEAAEREASWKNDGQYEMWLEENGCIKGWWYERDRCEQFGEEPPTAADFAYDCGCRL